MMKKMILWTLMLCTMLCLPLAASAEEAPRVNLKTSLGDIVVELDPAKAPKSTANFLEYVDSGFYNGTIFHRVIPGFMVQGGGFTADLQKKDTREPIENEAKNGLKNDRGTIAMARTNDPHSATAQFYINSVDNDSLNQGRAPGWGYAVFGKVVTGMDVVDEISKVETERKNYMSNVPVEPVKILEATRVKGE